MVCNGTRINVVSFLSDKMGQKRVENTRMWLNIRNTWGSFFGLCSNRFSFKIAKRFEGFDDLAACCT